MNHDAFRFRSIDYQEWRSRELIDVLKCGSLPTVKNRYCVSNSRGKKKVFSR